MEPEAAKSSAGLWGSGPDVRVGPDSGSAFHGGRGQWLRWFRPSFRERRALGQEAGGSPGLVQQLPSPGRRLSEFCPVRAVRSAPSEGVGCSLRSCSVLGQTRLQPWLSPASPSVPGQTGVGRWAGSLGAGEGVRSTGGGCAPHPLGILPAGVCGGVAEGSAVLLLRVPTCSGRTYL